MFISAVVAYSGVAADDDVDHHKIIIKYTLYTVHWQREIDRERKIDKCNIFSPFNTRLINFFYLLNVVCSCFACSKFNMIATSNHTRTSHFIYFPFKMQMEQHVSRHSGQIWQIRVTEELQTVFHSLLHSFLHSLADQFEEIHILHLVFLAMTFISQMRHIRQ